MSEAIAKIRVDLWARWTAGDRVLVESYFETDPSLFADDELALDLIYSEVLLREAFGDRVGVEEYLSRFPRFATPLSRQFELHAIIRGQPEPVSAQVLPSLPGFDFHHELGRGAWGIVYEARQTSLARRVAVKMQHPNGRQEQDALLRREARLVAKLNHPSIAQLYDYGEYDGRSYVVMELVEGGSLDAAIKTRGVYPPQEAAKLIEAVARAIHSAHECGVIHRDLKPANILLGSDGIPKVTDFGLAKDVAGSGSLGSSGILIGTWQYMAPEQLTGQSQAVGRATDVYALGLILHELLTGEPFLRATAFPFLQLQRVGAPPPLAAHVPRDLDAIRQMCLEAQSEDRYATAAALADDLLRYLQKQSVVARRRRAPTRRTLIRFGLGALAVAAGGMTFAALRGRREDPEDVIRSIEARLSRGEPVVLIPAHGGPGWSRWQIQGDANQAPQISFDEFSVQSWGIGLLELVRDPMRIAYRLTAEIRHDESDATGEVGIYFAHRESGSRGGIHSFVQFSFNDIQPGRLVSFVPHFYAMGGLQGHWNLQVPGYARQMHAASGAGKTTWRKLLVEVTPAEVRSYWDDGREVGSYLVDDLVQRMKDTVAEVIQRSPNHLYAREVDTNFSPRGGLGLYVLRGAAAFRAVTLEPL